MSNYAIYNIYYISITDLDIYIFNYIIIFAIESITVIIVLLIIYSNYDYKNNKDFIYNSTKKVKTNNLPRFFFFISN